MNLHLQPLRILTDILQKKGPKLDLFLTPDLYYLIPQREVWSSTIASLPILINSQRAKSFNSSVFVQSAALPGQRGSMSAPIRPVE